MPRFMSEPANCSRSAASPGKSAITLSPSAMARRYASSALGGLLIEEPTGDRKRNRGQGEQPDRTADHALVPAQPLRRNCSPRRRAGADRLIPHKPLQVGRKFPSRFVALARLLRDRLENDR